MTEVPGPNVYILVPPVSNGGLILVTVHTYSVSRGVLQSHGTLTYEPVHGGWSSYGPCSEDCGPGTKSRTCTDPAPAHGGDDCAGSSSAACNLGECVCGAI